MKWDDLLTVSANLPKAQIPKSESSGKESEVSCNGVTYQGIRNVRFSENLALFISLLLPFVIPISFFSYLVITVKFSRIE